MAKKQQIEFLHPNVLLVITPKGIIVELFTPIRAQVIKSIGNLPLEHLSISILLSKTMSIKSCIASQANGIRIAISEWGKINIEPLREYPKGLIKYHNYNPKTVKYLFQIKLHLN